MTQAVRVTGPRKTALWHKFVRYGAVDDHLRLGWMLAGGAPYPVHGEWSKYMVWLCDCPPREPKAPAQWVRCHELREGDSV